MRLVRLDEIPVPIHVTLKFHYGKFLADTLAKQNYLWVHVTLPSMDLKTKRCPHFTNVNMDNWNTELLQINPKSVFLGPCSQWESALSQLILGRPVTTGATAHQGVMHYYVGQEGQPLLPSSLSLEGRNCLHPLPLLLFSEGETCLQKRDKLFVQKCSLRLGSEPMWSGFRVQCLSPEPVE